MTSVFEKASKASKGNHGKRTPCKKGIIYLKFEENRFSYLFDTRTSVIKIGLPNLEIYQFPHSERLKHSKEHLKQGLYVEIKENH